jgi:single-strand DNA-binding protein
MNKAILIGRFTRDPEVRYTDGGTSIARFTLAVDRRFKQEGGQQADFISCIAFGKTAEFVEKWFRQGMKIVVEGRIQTGSYTNKDGVKVYTTDVVAENVEFAESKAAGGGQGHAPEPSLADANDGFMPIDGSIDEELPFN